MSILTNYQGAKNSGRFSNSTAVFRREVSGV